jgi:DNA mismatch endonuclease (patch repair protein)
MADIFTKAKRSSVMARIRSKGNLETELAMMRFFREHNITGWRRQQVVFGNPDFIFRAVHLAVFVDGCFWHGCHRHGRIPTGNRDYWLNKIARNKNRDRIVTRTLRKEGWRVLRIWHHELARKNAKRLVRRFRDALAPAACLATAGQHGLATVCRALINSNEFVLLQ